MVASRCATGIGAATTSSLTLAPSAAKAGVDSESASAVKIPRFESLLIIGLLLMCGRGGGFRIAKNQFQKDSRGRPNEEAALTEFRQLHSRIEDTEAIQLAAHAVMNGKTKTHVVDGLTRTIGRTAMARNQMHDRVAIGIEPIAGKGEGRPIAWPQIQHGFQEGATAFKIVGAQRYVIKHGTLTQWRRHHRHALSNRWRRAS